MKLKSVTPIVGVLGIAVSVFPSGVQAQVAPAPTQIAVEPSERSKDLRQALNLLAMSGNLSVELVRVKNIRASVVARWLDPTHNSPVTLEWYFDPNEKTIPALKEVARSPIFDVAPPSAQKVELPAGMSNVVSIDQRNVLYLIGTPEGIAKTKDLVAILDKPIKQVEVQTQFVLMDDETRSKLKIDLAKKTAGTEQQVGINVLPHDFQSALKTLVDAGKAKILTNARVTAINDLPAYFGTSNSPVSTLGYKDAAGVFHAIPTSTEADKTGADLRVGTVSAFSVRSTINTDNTVTMLINPSRVLELSVGKNKLPLSTLDKNETVTNVFDGDTVALTGLGQRFVTVEGDQGKVDLNDVVVFVTPRIVRRLGDEQGA